MRQHQHIQLAHTQTAQLRQHPALALPRPGIKQQGVLACLQQHGQTLPNIENLDAQRASVGAGG
jgi:hypothetical protein